MHGSQRVIVTGTLRVTSFGYALDPEDGGAFWRLDIQGDAYNGHTGRRIRHHAGRPVTVMGTACSPNRLALERLWPGDGLPPPPPPSLAARIRRSFWRKVWKI